MHICSTELLVILDPKHACIVLYDKSTVLINLKSSLNFQVIVIVISYNNLCMLNHK